MTRRLQPMPTLQARLAAAIVAQRGVRPAAAARMADEIMKDIARPVADLIQASWRAVVDNVLFDTELEAVRPGEEESSTEVYGAVLDVAAACLTGWAAALEMAGHHSRRAPAAPSAEVLTLPPRAGSPVPIQIEEAAA